MYRIRLGSGEEAVFRTVEELTVAVRTGVVSPMAEVFHNAGNRWLPIHVHPDYKAVVAGNVPAAAGEPRSPIPVVATRKVPGLEKKPEEAPANQTLPRAAAGVEVEQPPEPAPPESVKPEPVKALAPVAEFWVPASEPESAPVLELTPPAIRESGLGRAHATRASRAGKLRTILALSMGLAAVGLVGGGGYATWRYVLPRLERPQGGSALSEGMPPAPAALIAPRRDSFPTSYPIPAPPLPTGPTGAAETHGAAPVDPAEVRTFRLPATRNKTAGYYESYADARAEMDDALTYIGFQHVFAPARFSSPEDMRATRRLVAAAGNIFRVYRGQEVMLEQTFRPDDAGGRGTLREPFEASEAARSLISDVDSLLGILVAQEGRVRSDGASLHFDEPHAAQGYAEVRREITDAIRVWKDSGETATRVTMPRLLRAFDGAVPPPVGGRP